jgi:hypothetical protein
MGQFKPMVKMETTEPSVILKLKKGGHVSSDKDENGHTNMKGAGFKAKYSEEACEGESPKKPSMMDRRKAMSGAMLNSKNGGKAEKKAMGGMMGRPAMAAPAMDPRRAAMMKAMMARKAAMGAVPMAAPMAAPGMPAMKKGGKADMDQDKAMVKKAFKQHDMQEHKGGKGGKGTKLKLATGGLTNPMKKGGSINDFLHTKTVKMKTAEGYQKYAEGGAVSGNALKTVNMVTAGKATGGLTNPMKKGGSINDFLHTKTVKMKTADGYQKYAEGGAVSGNALKTVNMVTAGKATGGVVNGMATGGLTNPMKKGGAAKKHFATGGSVSTGRAVAMPKHPVSKPVSNTAQSGTFKEGGKVSKFQVGGGAGNTDMGTDMTGGGYDRYYTDLEKGNVKDREAITGLPGRAYSAAKRLLGIKPEAGAGRGNVNPPLVRKSGGSAKR